MKFLQSNILPLVDEDVSQLDMIDPNTPHLNLYSFEAKDVLCQDIFDGDKMPDTIRTQCLMVANAIISGAGVEYGIVHDIVLVGSLASYHYSSYSDIDIHIIVDAESEEFKQELNEFRLKWNKEHEITINGFEAELYFQDVNEVNKSNGVYSIARNEWVKFPNKDDEYQFDKMRVEQISFDFISRINELSGDDYEAAAELDTDIKRLRKCGLESPAGELSEENIAFKVLRRTGEIKKLKDIIKNTMKSTMEESIQPNECHAFVSDFVNTVMSLGTCSDNDIDQLTNTLQRKWDICCGYCDIDEEVELEIDQFIYNITTSADKGEWELFDSYLAELVDYINSLQVFAESIGNVITESNTTTFENALNEWRMGKHTRNAITRAAISGALGFGAGALTMNQINTPRLDKIEQNMSVESVLDTINASNNDKTVAPFNDTINTQKQANENKWQYVHSGEQVKASQACIDHLHQFEKLVLEPYLPTRKERREYEQSGVKNNVGKTIGWGHKIKSTDPGWLKTCNRITKAQADSIYKEDIKEFEHYTQTMINSLPGKAGNASVWPQGFIDAVISLEFNMGPKTFRESELYKTIRKCRYDAETGCIRRDDYIATTKLIKSTSVIEDGHKPRREQEYSMAMHIR